MRSYFIKTPGIITKLFPHIAWQLSEKQSGKIELTFDDGPDPDSTPILLDILGRHQIQSTFFVTGSKAKRHPELLSSMMAAGHIIANHGFEHLDGWKSSTDEYILNIQRSQDVCESRLFRPPYGRITRDQYRHIRKQTRLKIKMWSLMPGDFDPRVSHPQLLKRLVKHTKSRDIIALHDTPEAVDKLRNVINPFMDWLISNNLGVLPQPSRSKA